MDELTLLRELVADEPAEDEQAGSRGLATAVNRPSRSTQNKPTPNRGRCWLRRVRRRRGGDVRGPFRPDRRRAWRSRLRRVGSTVVGIVRALAVFTASQAPVAGSSKDRRRIVFAKYVNLEESDLYSMNPDGEDLHSYPGACSELEPGRVPEWNEDRLLRSFHRYRDCRRCQLPAGIYVMNADGTGQRLVRAGSLALPGRLTEEDRLLALEEWCALALRRRTPTEAMFAV